MPNKQNGISFSAALNNLMNKVQVCVFAEAIKNLPPDELSALNDALALDAKILSTSLIRKALFDSGISVSKYSIHNHRFGTCICVDR